MQRKKIQNGKGHGCRELQWGGGLELTVKPIDFVWCTSNLENLEGEIGTAICFETIAYAQEVRSHKKTQIQDPGRVVLYTKIEVAEEPRLHSNKRATARHQRNEACASVQCVGGVATAFPWVHHCS